MHHQHRWITNLIYGEFSNHAKTKIIGQVGIAQTFIDVDSTLGFLIPELYHFYMKMAHLGFAHILIKQ